MKALKYMYSGLGIAFLAAGLASCIKDYDNPADGTMGEQITLFALRQAYRGSEVTLNPDVTGGASKIQGVVISDRTAQNIEAGTFVLQQTQLTSNTAGDVVRGIIVKMNGGTAGYNLGDSLNIVISGAKLDRVSGNMTLSGIDATDVTVLATGRTPLKRDVTQGMLNELPDQYESTLVSLHADIADYTAGATFSGLKKLNDNSGVVVYLNTRSTASFAGASVPVNAQFTGIAGFLNESGKDTAGAKRIISLRNSADVQFSSGALYSNFPERFETPDVAAKSSYNSGTNIVALSTGNWYLLQAILGNTVLSDKFNLPGKQSIRMQQNLTTSGYTQMNFDVPDGASKVTVFYGKYATDARSSLRLEYSVDGGTTWTAVGSNITDMPDKANKQASWSVNITGPVRFRINKLGIGTSNNGRLCLDDFAIYKKL